VISAVRFIVLSHTFNHG